MKQIRQLTVALAVAVALVSFAQAQQDGPLFPLTVIHFNDLYARYNQVNLEGFTCVGQERCQGGYPRQVSVVRQLQVEAENSLYVNSGGSFKGTLWYTVHRWEVVAAMLNVLPADAMTLGRFDFFHGLEGLNPFMEASETPIVLTNVDNSAEQSFVNFERSVVVERSGRRIGILGVIRPDVSAIGNPGNLTFSDPVEAVREESARLAADGVDIVINRGGIRGDLQAGTVTYKQLFEVLPFENRLYSMLLRGNHIMTVLEDSVRTATVNNGTVQARDLLQVSGLRATYRINNPPGRRLVSLEVLCQQCSGEVYEPVNPFREYRVVVTDFLAEGGDRFSAFARYGMDLQQGPIDLDAFEEYVERRSPLRDEAGGRIRFVF
uniref:5'-Nucleotidase C-terminal domain-containing protein n=1 Tax=Anopheles merus TaxID=30066 RepID=A0A182VAW9_ANOME